MGAAAAYLDARARGSNLIDCAPSHPAKADAVKFGAPPGVRCLVGNNKKGERGGGASWHRAHWCLLQRRFGNGLLKRFEE
jgi:hypothetical protein